MCFNNINKKIPKTAGNPITVYKVVTRLKEDWETVPGKYETLHYPFVYELGKTYTKNLKTVLSFYWKSRFAWEINGEAYHAFSTARRALSQEGYNVILECRIPKGTPFKRNDHDEEYVSTSLEIVREVTREELLDHEFKYATGSDVLQ